MLFLDKNRNENYFEMAVDIKEKMEKVLSFFVDNVPLSCKNRFFERI